MSLAVTLGMTYPVQLDVLRPLQYDRVQLALRVAIAILMGWVGITLGWLMWLAFLALPLVAAIALSTQTSETYLHGAGMKVWRVIDWFVALTAYLLLVTDRFPLDDRETVRVQLQVTGHPTAGRALLRLLTSLPSLVVLALLGIVAWVLFLVGAVTILVGETVPRSVHDFQTGVVRWQARLLAYHASLVEEYPPFSFGDRAHAAPPASVVSR